MEEFTSLLAFNSVGLLKDFIGVVISVAGVVGFIVVFIAMYTAGLEGTREVGMLKAVGALPAYILTLPFRGLLLTAISGAVAGILMMYGTQFLVKRTTPSSLDEENVKDAVSGAGLRTQHVRLIKM